MDIRELEDFNINDAVKFHDELNPALWKDDKLRPEVREQLLAIADDFLSELGISGLKVKDVTVSGSNAAYTYTPHSDLDLHILVDFKQLPNDEIYQELFTSKKSLYNDSHDITVRGVPVELYVQDSNQPVVSVGEYSLKNDEWLKFPSKRKANFNQSATRAKYEKLGTMIELALQSDNLKQVDKVLKIIRQYRKAGLDKTGEFGPENLAFKALRNMGLIKKLYDYKNKLHSKELSIENVNEILDKESAAKVYWSQDNYMTGGKVSQMYTLYTAAAQDKNKNILKYNFYDFPKYSLTAVEFSRAVGPWGDSFSIDNAGDQYTVFATLIKTFTEYLSKHKPKYIMFGAKEPSRAKLYQTFVNRFASKFGYKQINPDSIPKPVSAMILNSGDTPFLLARTDLVKEILDTQPGKTNKAVWDYSDPSMIQLNFVASNGQPYLLDFLEPHLGPDEINQYDLLPDASDKYLDRGYFVQFEQKHKRSPWKQGKQGIEGTGAAAEVFGIVTNAILQFVKKKKPTYLYFQAAEQNRVSLYSALLKKILPSLPGWKANGPTNDGVFMLYSPVKKVTKEDGQKGKFVYHVTPTKNLQSIAKNGLTPNLGDRSNKISDEVKGIYVFPDKLSAEDAVMNWLGDEFEDEHLTMLKIDISDLENNIQKGADYELIVNATIEPKRIKKVNIDLSEASGYIPSKKEKNDPRFKTALTVDVKPDSIKKNAKAFGWDISRDGKPPLLRK